LRPAASTLSYRKFGRAHLANHNIVEKSRWMTTTGWDHLQTLALAGLLAWASGLRLYLVVFMLGLAARFQYIELPPGLQVLAHPYVIGAAGLLLALEFLADKVPGLDTAWDAIHTFIRIPAGALLAAGATGDDVSALTVAAGLLGGTITAGTHFAKAGSRAAINTSPEPFTNWGASFTEDALVVGGTWLAFAHPAIFVVFMAIFLIAIAWVLPKVWRFLKRVFAFLATRAAASRSRTTTSPRSSP
jgi:Domain of unknown function (DUF4126)